MGARLCDSQEAGEEDLGSIALLSSPAFDH